MKNPRAARRYALALFNLAGETGGVEKVLDDLRLIRTLLDDSDELKAFVAHPALTLDQQEDSGWSEPATRQDGIKREQVEFHHDQDVRLVCRHAA